MSDGEKLKRNHWFKVKTHDYNKNTIQIQALNGYLAHQDDPFAPGGRRGPRADLHSAKRYGAVDS